MSFLDRYADQVNDDVAGGAAPADAGAFHAKRRLRNAFSIDVDEIDVDPQHREHFDQESLQRLSASLKEHGQLQPVRVRFDKGRQRYVLIAGERRLRAAKLAGLTAIDCILLEGNFSREDILREQILENALREDLKPTEQARAFRDLMDAQGWNGKQLAEHLHVHPSTVSRALALLDLADEAREKVDAGELTLTGALSQRRPCSPAGRKPRQRPTRERKIKTSVGITVTLKARKLLHDEHVCAALQEALGSLRPAA